MTTTSFSESVKYGGRLFGFFFGNLLLGGGIIALGGVLAVPEIQAWSGSGTVQTAPLAGGLVLGLIGFATLTIGNFALVYKLVSDAVSKGVGTPTAQPTADVVETEAATESDDESAESKTAEQPTEPPVDQPAQASADAPSQQQPAQTSAPRADQPSPADQPAGEPARATDRAAEQPQPARSNPKERTAEEIAFGANSDQSETRDRPQDVVDEEWVGPEEPETNEPADEPEPESEIDRSEMETAGNPSSDPLSEQFDT